MNEACILVTGGTGAIGRAIVGALLARGDTVVATGASRESVEALAAEQPRASDRLHGYAADLTTGRAAADLSKWLADRALLPTGLVNAARDRRFLATEPDGTVSRENFIGELVLGTVLPYELSISIANSPGARLESIVNIASMYGLVAPTPALYQLDLSRSSIAYGIAKAGMVQMTRELSVRLAPRIRVNAVSFGGVAGRSDLAFEQRYAALCPAGRMLRKDEVAAPVLFLLDPASSSMTGANLVADGGWTAW
ncbi:MAG: SDR family oxidoreductase [Magnetospirillum sp.]|nr:SDR family oxidoreductase [Magnetospirillum sp.]